MTPKSNIHTHTTFVDGRDSAEALVRAALARGFHTLGFSEHGHADYDDCSMSPEAEPLYRAEVRRLRAAYADRIHVALGYEHDALYPADLSPYDFVIESVHYLRVGGEYACVDHTRPIFERNLRERFGGDPYALCREYYRTVAEACQRTPAQVIGHLDLVMKFNERRDLFDDADPRYLRCAEEAAECVARSGKLVEVNTGAMARGYRTEPYPGRLLLTRLCALGAPILFSSDCHDARLLDFGFDRAMDLARACGYRSAWMLRGPEFVEYAL